MQLEPRVQALIHGAARGEILILTWGELLKGSILMFKLGGLDGRHAV
jgi:hypothetical protein